MKYYNYTDPTPSMVKDLNLFSRLDQEQFRLFGLKVFYFKLKDHQVNYDSVFRDYFSFPDYDEPAEIRAFLHLDPNTSHALGDTGAVQNADRSGTLSLNIQMIENDIGRRPILGDVLYSLQLQQKFQIYEIAKDTYRLSKPLRYLCKIRLLQESR